jgi:hypothetical protein
MAGRTRATSSRPSRARGTNGVLLATREGGHHPPRRFVHMQTDEWAITSDVPPEGVSSSPVADVILVGRLGAYVYPADAAFHVRASPSSCAPTSVDDLARAEEAERGAVRSCSDLGLDFVRHVTLLRGGGVDGGGDVTEDPLQPSLLHPPSHHEAEEEERCSCSEDDLEKDEDEDEDERGGEEAGDIPPADEEWE